MALVVGDLENERLNEREGDADTDHFPGKATMSGGRDGRTQKGVCVRERERLTDNLALLSRWKNDTL